MATLTIADLDNGKRDLQTVDAVANSLSPTTTTRYGDAVRTLAGALAALGYAVPVAYASGLTITARTQTVEYGGAIYAPVSVPFTTGAWNPRQWYPIQNVLNDHKLLVFETLAEAQAVAATLPNGQVVEVIMDGTRAGARTRYKVQTGDLEFVENLDQLKLDLANADEDRGASMVGFLPFGAGEVATDVQTQLRNIQIWSVNVKDAPFYAKGDGTTDDTAAIQAAINYLNPNIWGAPFNYQQGGGTVFFPKGVYRITAPLKLAPFVTLEGVGPDGWTGGGAGIGLTGPTSPANGSAIYADFGATTETCAIDTQNWSVAGGTLYAATNMTPIKVEQLSGTYTYCQGAGLRNIAVFCTNSTRFGVRLQGAALANLENVSIMGFKVGLFSNCVWSTDYRKLFVLATQVGIAQVTNNDVKVSGVFDLDGWGASNGVTITNNNAVTAANKPSFWSANDTNYNCTSIYAVGCFSLRYERATTQHTGRSWYMEQTDASFGALYIEDLPYLSSGSTPGAFNGYNAAASNFSVLIENLHSDSNGVTLFNNLTNLPCTLLSMSGIQGQTLGPAVSGNTKLMYGLNVNRNGAFGDYKPNSLLINMAPETGSWTPGLTNIRGTGVTTAGVWTKIGNLYLFTVTITGTGITATGGGASIISTPFDGTAGVARPARSTAVAVSTANLQAASGLMRNDANLLISAIGTTTQIVVTGTVEAA